MYEITDMQDRKIYLFFVYSNLFDGERSQPNLPINPSQSEP